MKKNKIKIIFVTTILAFMTNSINIAIAEDTSTLEDPKKNTSKHMEMRVDTENQINILDKEARLELSKEQKESLIRATLGYNIQRKKIDITYERGSKKLEELDMGSSETAIELQERYQEDVKNINDAFDNSIERILNNEQRKNLEKYQEKKILEEDRRQKEEMEKIKQEWIKERKKIKYSNQ